MRGKHLLKDAVDLVVIGGGINGCAIAADAALRGLSVLGCEQGDFASHTSSNSTSIIHGGLGYVPRGHFRFVQKALRERQTLLDVAPHLVRPMPFVLPHSTYGKSPWLVRTGLAIYDALGGVSNSMPLTRSVTRSNDPTLFSNVLPDVNSGLVYFDGATDDARLTVLHAQQAHQHGATMMPQTRLINAGTDSNEWYLTLQPQFGEPFDVRTKAVVNATGAWVTSTANLLQTPLEHRVSLIKGSHLIIPKLYEGEHAYVLQHHDGRIIFVTPFHGKSLVGTTDIRFEGDPSHVTITPEETDYLLDALRLYFDNAPDAEQILSTRSGLRTLLAGDDPSKLSRDYALQFSMHPAPALTVYGGKITTARKLGEDVVTALAPVFPNLPPSLTSRTYLPGATCCFPDYKQHARKQYPWLNEETLTRYLNSYGTNLEKILEGCTSEADLGTCFAPTFYKVEVDYLFREEWGRDLQALLWLRTKMGLTIDEEGRDALAAYLEVLSGEAAANKSTFSSQDKLQRSSSQSGRHRFFSTHTQPEEQASSYSRTLKVSSAMLSLFNQMLDATPSQGSQLKDHQRCG